MCKSKTFSRFGRLLAALTLLCALLCASAGAEKLAVEDVPTLDAAGTAEARIEAAPIAEEPADMPMLKTVSARADGVLQTGGLPKAVTAPRAELCSEYPAAEEAIYAGLLARAETINLYSYGIPLTDIQNVYQSVINEHPELFYVEAEYKYSCAETAVNAIYPGYNTSYGPAEEERFRAVCDEILGQLEPGWSDLQKLLFLHDYIVTHVEYDNSLSRYNAYNALVEHSAVCQGYSLSFSYLGRQAGLDIRYVTSNTIVHAWNAVWLDGELFYIDCTWDDPSNGWYEGYCTHDNFLRSRDGAVTTGHTSSDWLCDGADVYENDVSSTRYEDPANAWWRDLHTAVAQLGSICAYGTSASEYNVLIRDLNTGAVQTIALSEPAIWPVFDQPGYYWDSSYFSFVTWDGAFCFTTDESVYRLFVNGMLELIYTLTEEERSAGSLYGLVSDGGELYYALGTAPSGVSFTRKALGAPAHVHDYSYLVTIEPACKTPGERTCTCTVCGDVYTDVIPALGHEFDYYPAAEPTTEADGNVEYWYCPDCGSYFLDADGLTETSADEVIVPRLDEPLPPITTPTLTVESVTGRSGSIVDVKIGLTDSPGIAGAMLRLDYAPELVLKNITVGDALAGLTFTRPGDLSENPVTLLWDGLDADATNGTVLTLTFEIPATAADGLYAVTLSCEPDGVYADDLTDVLPTFVDGGITVRNVLRGDMNGDNMRNAKDVTMMRRALAGGYGISVSLDSADVNNDGSVNAKDVTTLRRFLAGGYGITLN